jgi:hypothetical protein
MGFLELGDRNGEVRVEGFHRGMPQEFHQVPGMHLVPSLAPLKAMGGAGGPQGMDADVLLDPRLSGIALEPQAQHAPADPVPSFAQEHIFQIRF